MSDFTAWKSLAMHLNRPMLEVLNMADDGTLADAIRERNALIPAEFRATGYTTCTRCGGTVRHRHMCPCGELAPGREHLDGRDARRQLWAKRPEPE